MRYTRLLALFTLSMPGLMVTMEVARSGSEPVLASSTEIDRLIHQLGSSTPAEREAAAKKLQTLGAPALAGLRRALKTSDARTQREAQAIIAAIEHQTIVADAFTPTKVHLKAKK